MYGTPEGGINTLVDINYDSLKQTIICNFMNQPPENLKHCNASIASGINCKIHHGDYHSTGTGEIISTPAIAIDGLTEFCFSVNASSGNLIVIVEGTSVVDISKLGIAICATLSQFNIILIQVKMTTCTPLLLLLSY